MKQLVIRETVEKTIRLTIGEDITEERAKELEESNDYNQFWEIQNELSNPEPEEQMINFNMNIENND